MVRRKKRVFPRPKQVRVIWLDAISRHSVYGTLGDVLEASKLVRRESSGWLLRYDDELTVICRDFDAPEDDEAEPHYGDTQTMPSGWVLGVYEGKRVVERERSKSLVQASESRERHGGATTENEGAGARPAPADSPPAAEGTHPAAAN